MGTAMKAREQVTSSTGRCPLIAFKFFVRTALTGIRSQPLFYSSVTEGNISAHSDALASAKRWIHNKSGHTCGSVRSPGGGGTVRYLVRRRGLLRCLSWYCEEGTTQTVVNT